MDDNQIWSVYERNCLYYSKCKNLKNCPNIHDDNCYCHKNAIVQPDLIAECGFSIYDIKPNINKKCYIGSGELCSICIEPIFTKKSAWLTPCSHVFHRKCLINNYQYRKIHNMMIEFTNEVPCPICRTGLVDCCVGLQTIDKYNSKNGLDTLENFWSNIDYIPYILCYKCEKALGMNKECAICEYYRITGDI